MSIDLIVSQKIEEEAEEAVKSLVPNPPEDGFFRTFSYLNHKRKQLYP